MIKNENFSPKNNEMEYKSVNQGNLLHFPGTIKMEEGNNPTTTGAVTGMPQTPKTEAEDSSEENLETFKLKGYKKRNSDKFKLSSEKSPSSKQTNSKHFRSIVSNEVESHRFLKSFF